MKSKLYLETTLPSYLAGWPSRAWWESRRPEFDLYVPELVVQDVRAGDHLLTWNCRHSAKAELYRAMRNIVQRYGFDLPNLRTPEELMGEEQ